MSAAEDLAAAVDEMRERRERLLEQARKQRRRDEFFSTFAIIAVIAANVGWTWRGGEAGFRATVVVLLTIIAICETRRRR